LGTNPYVLSMIPPQTDKTVMNQPFLVKKGFEIAEKMEEGALGGNLPRS